jgi:hypothetical protein
METAAALGLEYAEIDAEDIDKRMVLAKPLDQVGPKLINVIVRQHPRVLR